MSPTVAKMLGHPIMEDDVPPVLGNRVRSTSARRDTRNDRTHRQRRIAAQIMGMSESEEGGIFPDEAEEIKDVGTGFTSIKTDDKNAKEEKPGDPTNPYPDGEGAKEPLMTPSVALVAPDVTPDALEPLDPSEVPVPPEPPKIPSVPAIEPTAAAPASDPLDVLLGRSSSPQTGPPVNPAAGMAAAEALLNIDPMTALAQGSGMPEHKSGDAKKIMESFYRYGRA